MIWSGTWDESEPVSEAKGWLGACGGGGPWNMSMKSGTPGCGACNCGGIERWSLPESHEIAIFSPVKCK